MLDQAVVLDVLGDVEINSLEHEANAESPKKRKDATKEEVEEKELEPGDGSAS